MAFRVGLLGRGVSVVKIGKKSIKSTLMRSISQESR